MRQLLIVLLLAALVHAEENFGPDTLESGVHCENAKLRPLDAGSFLVTWGVLIGSDAPGYGQKILLDGTPNGERINYRNSFPHIFLSAADVDVIQLSDGGEVDLIGHNGNSHHEIQFVSRGGRLLGASINGNCSAPFGGNWNYGLFYTFWTSQNTNGGGNVLYWYDDVGNIMQQDTLYGRPAVYAISNDSCSTLLRRTEYAAGERNFLALTVHVCHDDGRIDPPDTLFAEDVSASPVLPLNALMTNDGMITGVLFRLFDEDSNGTPDVIQSRLFMYRSDQRFVGDWINYRSYENNLAPTRVDLDALPSGELLLSTFVPDPADPTIRFSALDEFGAVRPLGHGIHLPANQTLSGLDVRTDDESVYYAMSTLPESGEPDSLSAVMIGAFPIRLLEPNNAAPRAAVITSLDLSVYPNPFNGAARIQFDLPANGQTMISVFDLNGRHVAELANGYYNAGHHEYAWSADQLPSGMYWVRLRTNENVQVQKALLIR